MATSAFPRSSGALLLILLVAVTPVHGALGQRVPLWATITEFYPATNTTALLATLPSAAARTTGSATLSSTGRSDRAFVRGLCFHDATPQECVQCLSMAATSISSTCDANSHRCAGRWTDGCFLSYADANDTTPGEGAFRGRAISSTDPLADASGPDLERLASVAQFLAPRAALSDNMLATVDTTAVASYYAERSTVRVLAQCARDRTAADCNRCLEYSARVVAESCCWGLEYPWRDGVAAAVAAFNCYLRFEVSTVPVPLRKRIAMFIHDATPQECVQCLSVAATNISSSCAANKHRAGVLSDGCFVSYANATTPGEDALCPRVISGTDPLRRSASGPVLEERLAAPAQFLAPRAAVNDNILAAVDNAGLAWDYAARSTVRVLAQRARDRTEAECDGVAGAVLALYCYLRFEVTTVPLSLLLFGIEYSARVAASCCCGLDPWRDGVAGAVLAFSCYLHFEVTTVQVPLRERIGMGINHYPITTAFLTTVIVLLVVRGLIKAIYNCWMGRKNRAVNNARNTAAASVIVGFWKGRKIRTVNNARNTAAASVIVCFWTERKIRTVNNARNTAASGMASVPRAFHLLLLVLCLMHRATAQPATAPDEKHLLVQIKRAWGNPSVLTAWNGQGNHCTWPYVTCDDSSGRVTNLSLANTNVAGPVPDAIGGLSGLTSLDLFNNSINGTFPTSVYSCASLRYLDLSENYLAGELPADIGWKIGKNITFLILGGNNLNGTIPTSLSRLKKLQALGLDNNEFAGTIPEELGELTSLETLLLGYNWFAAGKLPASFKKLAKLRSFEVANCSLSGEFGSYVAEMRELELLNIADNAFTGGIPPVIWNLAKLKTLIMFRNKFTGDVVVQGDFRAVNLANIDLTQNKLSGPIPEAFGHLPKLVTLNLYFNTFSGEIPASIGRLPSLEKLSLFSNRLNGSLPPDLGKKSALVNIEVDDNQLTGAIPEGLCANGKFEALTASDNGLTGSIPAGLAGCATLRDLLLDNNKLSGKIPEALWRATKIRYVLVRNNRLRGTLPASLYMKLMTLRIDDNQFVGRIPAVAAGLRVFTAGNNNFSGEMPANLGDGMPLLENMNLSGNQLSGGIPRSLAKLGSLTQLDLSRNQLMGDIPAELGAMPPMLSMLNLSSNHLDGQVPPKLATYAYDRSFLDNPGLCHGGPGPGYLVGVRSCSAGSQAAGTSSRGVSPAFRTRLLAAAGALLVLVLVVVLAVFVVRYMKKRKRAAEEDGGWKITPYQNDLGFGVAAILRALTEENLIGSGGSGRVYRAAYTNRYNGNAGAVAVKQIRSAGQVDEKVEREFESEASILGGVRHNNIVRLLCFLSRDDSGAKLLVYDYMENGSLDGWLQGAGESMPSMGRREAGLDWPTRIRVAVGAAQGLCHMHHQCSPPIVHRDVKTSNILLDSEFRAKIADFGLARMLMQAGMPNTMSAVAGSFGYMAPECGYTRKVSEKVDVYSFGVVLLELTTGRIATDGGEHGSLAEWARHRYQSGGSIPDAIDNRIRDAGCSEEIEAVFRLGVMCTNASQSARPTMKDVLQILIKYAAPGERGSSALAAAARQPAEAAIQLQRI